MESYSRDWVVQVGDPHGHVVIGPHFKPNSSNIKIKFYFRKISQ